MRLVGELFLIFAASILAAFLWGGLAWLILWTFG